MTPPTDSSASSASSSARRSVPPFLLSSPGRVGVEELLTRGVLSAEAIRRLVHGDWGHVDNHDHAVNAAALLAEDRIHSPYRATDGSEVWITTDAMANENGDPAVRQVTTLLTPAEY